MKYRGDFIKKELEKIYDLSKKLEETPIVHIDSSYFVKDFLQDKFNKEFKEYMKYRVDLSWVKGFFYGYALGRGAEDND